MLVSKGRCPVVLVVSVVVVLEVYCRGSSGRCCRVCVGSDDDDKDD